MRCRLADPAEIESLREEYRRAMNCQIIHDSIHARPGWTLEYALEDNNGRLAGYGSVAIAGPWRDSPTVYEFHVAPFALDRVFDLFATLVRFAKPSAVETQTNDLALTTMLHAYCHEITPEAILFADALTTAFTIPGAEFRAVEVADHDTLQAASLDPDAAWVVTLDGEVAATGGILYHYNRPYGDVYMGVAEAFRQRGLGAYIVQELKRVCREGGSVPAARCNVSNVASRRTLQKAGFTPCGHLIGGRLIGEKIGSI